jgi:hypothetical protein
MRRKQAPLRIELRDGLTGLVVRLTVIAIKRPIIEERVNCQYQLQSNSFIAARCQRKRQSAKKKGMQRIAASPCALP